MGKRGGRGVAGAGGGAGGGGGGAGWRAPKRQSSRGGQNVLNRNKNLFTAFKNVKLLNPTKGYAINDCYFVIHTVC
jgi:hypothetical protein